MPRVKQEIKDSTAPPVFTARNILLSSEHYPEILKKYNELLQKDGEVNNLKFYREVIKPLIPHYHVQSWYKFLNRFKNEAGLIANKAMDIIMKSDANLDLEEKKIKEMALMSVASKLGLQVAGNIGYNALVEVLENPHKLPLKERIDLLFKTMRAQDSRAFAFKALREDAREQDKFDSLLDSGAYGDGESDPGQKEEY